MPIRLWSVVKSHSFQAGVGLRVDANSGTSEEAEPDGREEVDDDEEENPDEVDEVPVDRDPFEADVALLVELPGEAPAEHDDEADEPRGHVRAVDAGEQVE